MTMRGEHRDANRANWDERAAVHAKSRFYDVDGFVAGTREYWLHPSEPADLGDVKGKSLCHLQCHLGVETLSWARLGAARVVGLDFSPNAIRTARTLAERCGLADRSTFIESDVHDAVTALATYEPFDIVYVSVGAISWLPSITRWANIVSALLAPGGVLFMREVHPVLNAVYEREGKLEFVEAYFEHSEPQRSDDGESYTEGRPKLQNKTCFEWSHGMAEIIQALLNAGLSLELLREHKDAEFKAFDSMIEENGLYRLPPDLAERIPLTFSLRARRTR